MRGEAGALFAEPERDPAHQVLLEEQIDDDRRDHANHRSGHQDLAGGIASITQNFELESAKDPLLRGICKRILADESRHMGFSILSLPDETIICPGHGPITTVGEEKAHNPFFAGKV